MFRLLKRIHDLDSLFKSFVTIKALEMADIIQYGFVSSQANMFTISFVKLLNTYIAPVIHAFFATECDISWIIQSRSRGPEPRPNGNEVK